MTINGIHIPPEGQVFEVWLLDGGSRGSGFAQNIGQIKENLIFSYDAYFVSPFTYTDLFVTIEPENDPDPKQATSVTAPTFYIVCNNNDNRTRMIGYRPVGI